MLHILVPEEDGSSLPSAPSLTGFVLKKKENSPLVFNQLFDIVYLSNTFLGLLWLLKCKQMRQVVTFM